MGSLSVVVGAQWGDEGKGKLVDLLCRTANIVCRCQGGNNAGHTVVANEQTYFFHLIPSGVVNSSTIGVIGNGVVMNLPGLFEEENRGKNSLGTTKKGIGPTYASKVNRNGVRVCDLLGDWGKFCDKYQAIHDYMKRRYPTLTVDVEASLSKYKEFRAKLNGMVCDTTSLVNRQLDLTNTNVLVEGAQSCMLDIDFGTYPFVTSSNCSAGGVCTGLGIAPSRVSHVYGVVKCYTTRVGAGCFPTELNNEVASHLREVGHEFGVTTSRPRRIGWLDAVIVRYAHMINNFTAVALTKLDCLDNLKEIKIGTAYLDESTNQELVDFPADTDQLDRVKVKYIQVEGWNQSTGACRTFDQLPKQAQEYVLLVEKLIGIPVRWIGVGASRDSMIVLPPQSNGVYKSSN